MSKSTLQKSIIPVVAIIILLVLIALMAGMFTTKTAPTLLDKHKAPITGKTYQVVSTSEMLFEPVSASVNAKQATIISSRILARIEKINVRAGDNVKKGDILVELEKSDLKSQVLQAEEKIKAMQARQKEAQQNFVRAKELFEKSIMSAYDLDKSRADYLSVKAELTATKQVYNQAKATLTYATLKAPINGRVVDRFAEPGNTAQPGSKLLSLYNPLSLRVEAQVREKLALTLKQGQIIKVELPSLESSVNAEVEEIVPAANTGSRSFLIKASIQYNEKLLPGMYARLLVPAGTQDLLYVPKNLVAHAGQLDFVWLSNDGVLERRFVRLGHENSEEMVAIISGVSVGDIIAEPAS